MNDQNYAYESNRSFSHSFACLLIFFLVSTSFTVAQSHSWKIKKNGAWLLFPTTFHFEAISPTSKCEAKTTKINIWLDVLLFIYLVVETHTQIFFVAEEQAHESTVLSRAESNHEKKNLARASVILRTWCENRQEWLLLCDLINEVTELQETSHNKMSMKCSTVFFYFIK